MNMLFITMFVGLMVSEISRVSIFGYFPLSSFNNLFIYIYIYI